MKRIFTVLLFSCFLLNLSAQDIPNPGFEVWIDSVTYEEPESWNTENPLTAGDGVVTVEKSEDAASGAYSARLETKDMSGFHIPGFLTLGDYTWNDETQTGTITGGIPMTSFVTQVQGQYKYAGVDGDSAALIALSFRHPEGEDPDTVAIVVAFLHDAAEWTDFSFPLQQISPDSPDTFRIYIQSSGLGMPNWHVGSVLYVDDISISITTNVDETKEKSAITVYPNPTTDKVNFELASTENNREIIIFDMTGRMITRSDFTNRKVTIDLDKFPQGLYMYRVKAENKLQEAGSFVKQ